jgi:hypothetical protein
MRAVVHGLTSTKVPLTGYNEIERFLCAARRMTAGAFGCFAPDLYETATQFRLWRCVLVR